MTEEKAIESTPEPAANGLPSWQKKEVIRSEKIEHQPPSKEPMIHSLQDYVFSAYVFFAGIFAGMASLVIAEHFTLSYGMGGFSLPWAGLFCIIALFFTWKLEQWEVKT
ncbi:MAG TPA: hypothetical protein HA306_01075 [Methanosarcina sp.]|nr:hypothetical protein [Methanosarcina sp.]